ncbi:uncharacterized protein AMSG_11405 [Thecamonas trahens ATCC 50062]|uniref:PX domain-containing protein n=1 Tax=Thecamonas trahens ATCC 50062 TaxID=461836 RepID=A0A0L0DV24_THETB|nr:hypothetical protein AMSG_11405 [Thecamonas trahens ATCC 50062]KNC55936.1 hypothetical protein AMSG_11405 [Thecamonas trahens ATCC 50062]|eukprot:XP_013752708.1 hypothetical protein AMSG_11405 [Thecamonas trahens ATCC 50062]
MAADDCRRGKRAFAITRLDHATEESQAAACRAVQDALAEVVADDIAADSIAVRRLLDIDPVSHMSQRAVAVTASFLARDHTVYQIKVQIGTASWRLLRRFAQFRALARDLVAELGDSAPWACLMPKASYFGRKKPSVVAHRKNALNAFLQAAVADDAAWASPFLQIFLRVKANYRPLQPRTTAFSRKVTSLPPGAMYASLPSSLSGASAGAGASASLGSRPSSSPLRVPRAATSQAARATASSVGTDAWIQLFASGAVPADVMAVASSGDASPGAPSSYTQRVDEWSSLPVAPTMRQLHTTTPVEDDGTAPDDSVCDGTFYTDAGGVSSDDDEFFSASGDGG